MGVSSNSRYQFVNSLEANLMPSLPGGKAVQTLTSFVVRTGNNVRCRRPTARQPPKRVLCSRGVCCARVNPPTVCGISVMDLVGKVQSPPMMLSP